MDRRTRTEEPGNTCDTEDIEGPAGGECTIMTTKQSIVVALATCLLSGCTLEQILLGQEYAIQTPQAGACPRLTWQFVVNAQRSIGGALSNDGQQLIANLSGQLNADDSFQITATSVAGSRTANVTGRFTSLVSTLSIHGDAAGSGCDGQTFQLRLGGYFSRQGGSTTGGG
jgi:hypothetical protein